MRTSILLLIALHTTLASLAQSIPTFYWKLDESTGTTAHDQLGLSDGTVQGNCNWDPSGGHHAGALHLYGTGSMVALPPCDITTGTGDQITLACWFKPEIVSGTERVLMAKTIGNNTNDFIWSLSLVNYTGARFRVSTAGNVTAVDIPPSSLFSNTWYHLCAIYDGQNIRFYLNGSLTWTSGATGLIGFHPQAPATLGNLFNNSMPFYGWLDDVRVYDHALTEMEVIDLVVGDVPLGVATQAILLNADGRIVPPPGEWNDVRVMDLQGRTIEQRNITKNTAPVSLTNASAGVYLICLQGPDGMLTRPVLMP